METIWIASWNTAPQVPPELSVRLQTLILHEDESTGENIKKSEIRRFDCLEVIISAVQKQRCRARRRYKNHQLFSASLGPLGRNRFWHS
jgi:hypothetical protein